MKIKQCFADVKERKIFINYIEKFYYSGNKDNYALYPAFTYILY